MFGKLFGSAQPTEPTGSILIVDDSEVDRKIIEKILVKARYQVHECENPTKALNVAAAVQPDLILLDCHMPQMQGTDVCRELKRDERTKHIPVIFLTSDDAPSNILDCYEVEGENFVHKPVKARNLLTQVQNTISDHSEFSDEKH